MKPKITVLQGLPSSGKSRWAKEFVKNNKGWIRLNNDEFRLMFFNRQFDKGDTGAIDYARDVLVEHFMKYRKSNLIIDNTNLSEKRVEEYRKLATEHGYDFEVKSFCDVPLKLCIERDKYREYPVGEKVIRQMYNQFLKKDFPKIEEIPNVKDCWIFDLDGTLALINNRSPYDESKADQDFINKPVAHILHCILGIYDEGCLGEVEIILMSGRDEGRGREATIKWLEKNRIRYDHLYMRKSGDVRSDDIVKEELYNEFVKGKYNVKGVFDDRLKVCRLWYRLGLPLFRVGDPDADF